ncbi:MAG: efflux RND transporter periplasmic adaptor subunit [Myxococcaceae bacterium]
MRSLVCAAGVLSMGLLVGCKDAPAAAAQGAPKPVEVGVYEVTPASVMLTRELPGRTSPYRVAEVRARVDGIVLERLFEEGSDVKKGQQLFKIDPLPYQAALASAEASLARAQANVESNRLLAERYETLIAERAVSKQEYDNAVAAHKASEADVAAGKAAVQSARINVGYTRVTSPIDGRIGRSEVTEGAYVRMAEGNLMATVTQLDPMYVDVTQPSTEVLKLRRDLESGNLVRDGDGAKVTLALEDGTLYAHKGKLQFSDVTVNPTTGSITLRAIFPNPDGQLLPGMFVRAQLEEGTRPSALLVPQIALTRDAQGKASVLVVGKDNKVELRSVVAPRTVNDKWMVTEGLDAGDKVIVNGLQKVRPGAQVSIAQPQATRAAAR